MMPLRNELTASQQRSACDLIEAHRAQHHQSIASLAELSGLSRTQLWAYLRMQSNMPVWAFIKLCYAIKAPPAQVMPELCELAPLLSMKA